MNVEQAKQKIQNLPNKIVDEIILQRLSLGVVAIIRKRTLEGTFLEGSSPNANQYSSKPFPIPFGKLEKLVSKKELQNKEKYAIFTAKSGNTWVLVMGGYREYRRLCGKDTDHVSLNWSGRMLDNLGIVQQTHDTYSVGFSDPRSEQLAKWHTQLGAGKSHRLHKFFDLTENERARLTKFAGEEITKELIKAFQ